MHEIRMHHLDITFPYQPYDCQVQYMETVISALDTSKDAALESPTGTGKTLSLLCACLAWVKRQKTLIGGEIPAANRHAEEGNSDTSKSSYYRLLLPRIYYCSRTHSQLSQVVRELNKTVYRDTKVATLGSRDQLCVHEAVKKEKDNHSKVLKCRSLVKRRECHFYNSWEKQDNIMLDALYAEGGKVLDIEDLVKAATKHKHCPFYRSRQQQENAELVLLPYNYLLDPHLRSINKIDLKNSIVIFDEAHNLESVCQESVSTRVSTKDVAFCVKEVKAALLALTEKREEDRLLADETTEAFGAGMAKGEPEKKKKEINLNDVANLLESLQQFLDGIDELYETGKQIEKLKAENPGKVFDGRILLELLERSGLRRNKAGDYSSLLADLASFLADSRPEEDVGVVAIRDHGKKMMEFGSFLGKVFADSFVGTSHEGFTVLAEDPFKNFSAAQHFKLYAVKEGSMITLHYWCFSASPSLRSLRRRGVHSILVTSGTLAPLELFVRSLGLNFEYTLQNSHAAKSNQVLVVRVAKSADKANVLNGSYDNRSNPDYLVAVGDGVVRVANTTPDGILVFFSSYALMTQCVEMWQKYQSKQSLLWGAATVWERIKKHKDIYIEPKNKAELQSIRAQFEASILSRGGACFLAVARGKVSEGIDFSDSHSRAVVIIGIPYPPLNDVKVILKRSHVDQLYKEAKIEEKKQYMTGEQWYSTEGFRAVNQAVGRVLRHVNDFGVVVLLDSRFNRHTSSKFPKWVQHSFADAETTQESEMLLQKFFSSRCPGRQMQPKEGRAVWLSEKASAAQTRKLPATLNTSTEPANLQTIVSEYTSDRQATRRTREELNRMSQKENVNDEIEVVCEINTQAASSSKRTPFSLPPSSERTLVSHPPSSPPRPAALSSRPPSPKRIKLKANGRIGESAARSASEVTRKDGPAEEGNSTTISTREQRKIDIRNMLKSLGMREEVWDWMSEYQRTKDAEELARRVIARVLPLSRSAVIKLREFMPGRVQEMFDEALRP